MAISRRSPQILSTESDWSSPIISPESNNDPADNQKCSYADQVPNRGRILENAVFRYSHQGTYQICGFFSFGPILSMEMARTIRARLEEAPTLLLHPYAAVRRTFLRCTANQTPCNSTDWSNCASALETLRNAVITRKDHVGGFLSLGLSLVTFHRLISGASASTICRYTLSLIRPFYYSGQLNQSDTREILCLIFLDTTQSLFRAQMPVIQYQVEDPYLVDQHAGLCSTLLPLLYRVCILATAIRTKKIDDIPDSSSFDRLVTELKEWAPQISQAALDRFSDNEMMLLLAQANMHRTTALLILHRLKFPFGEHDSQAKELSQSLVWNVSHCLDVVGHYPPNITLVLLVAGAEAHDVAERHRILFLIEGIRGAAFYPFVSNLRMLLPRVWAELDLKSVQYLFCIFERYPQLSIPL
ncbi:hypothetical protein N7481_013400 [Penicillium waksmanii]|uniref:uncharacterized protein n=1 Tax=Penicillium waksmanii TaxID=69791 RepID=UPI0025467AF3|nr:uncharacterized protein N7481_013400 [Penicillium waksmanii]KAJ5963095.1 hypothetical protein N7481_013400 [Penicillium waksmanii]